MPHEIATINGKPAMMYVGEAPWHGLGTKFKTAPKSAEEVIQAARLDWEVGLKPVYVFDGGHFCAFPQYQATVRLDKWGQPDCVPFGLVGSNYTPLQNWEAASFFDPIVAAQGVAYETAGALRNGERIWVLVRVKGEEIRVRGSDVVEKYLLLSNGHDGRTALQIRFTPVRVVCTNTLACALSIGDDLLKVYHRPNIHRRVEEAQETVRRIFHHYSELAERYESLAKTAMTEEMLPKYLKAVIPDPKRRPNQKDRGFAEAIERANILRRTSAQLFQKGKGNDKPPIEGTLWAAYNGVLEMVDHYMAYDNPWQRMESVLFGDGERLKARAFEVAVGFSKN